MRGVIEARTPSHLRAFLLALAAALLVSIAVCLVPAQRAYADLAVYVGYAGGPYYEKKTYTDAELWGLSDGVIYEYSSIDGGGSLRKGFGVGVGLYELFTNAGLQPSDVWRFYFSTSDNYVEDDGGEGVGAWYYNNLQSTPRYYYPDLVNYFDFNTGEIQSVEAMSLLEQTRVSTPAILALESSYKKVFSADDPDWDDFSEMDDTAGYRLLYGQIAPNVSNSATSAHSIVALTCILGGNDGTELPEVEIDIDEQLANLVQGGQLEMKVGDEVTLFPELKSDDSTVSVEGIRDVTWYSSDPNVAQVTKNADGSITIRIVGEGTVSMGWSYGNSPYSQFVSGGSFGVSGSGGSEGSGDDDSGDDAFSSAGEAESITLDAGVSMHSASISSESAGGAEAAIAEGAGTEGGEVSEMLQITATQSVYELAFDEEPVEDSNPGWVYALAAGSFMAVGGVRRRREFERAKDPYLASAPAWGTGGGSAGGLGAEWADGSEAGPRSSSYIDDGDESERL